MSVASVPSAAAGRQRSVPAFDADWVGSVGLWFRKGLGVACLLGVVSWP
jgi:hypothetical protein